VLVITEAPMTTTTLASWFGSDRMIAKAIGQELAGCAWVGVPFAGGMSALAHIDARSLLVNDLHRHIINLARVAGHSALGPKLYRQLRRMPFHPVALKAAQSRCLEREATGITDLYSLPAVPPTQPMLPAFPDLEWALDYFIVAWMGRNGTAGTPGEFRAGLSLRWDAGGGDSNTRYRSAAASLVAWRRVLRRCNFTADDAFDFLDTVKDRAGHGLYVDAPWPDNGDGYTHKFTETQQRRLAQRLTEFPASRVVVRFGDHPLIRELYPEGLWTWRRLKGRNNANADVAECLIINGPSLAKGAA
jgi:DNA adenine methylase